MADMQINAAYGYTHKNAYAESNLYEMPPGIPEPKRVYPVSSTGAVQTSKKRQNYRFNICFAIFTVIIFLLTLAFVVFFLAHYLMNQPLDTQQSVDIEALKLLLNKSIEEAGFQASELKNAQLIIQVLNHSNQHQSSDLSDSIQKFKEQLIIPSCKDLPRNRPSGYYHIETSNGIIHAYCDTNTRSCSCNTTGGWTRVANLDMTDPTQQCPNGFEILNRNETPLRTCGRPNGHSRGCVSTMFPVNGIEYSNVCGRIVAYQIGSPSAFWGYTNGEDLNGYYIDGISMTHGQSPRQHIWSFVTAVSEGYNYNQYVCPCTRNSGTYGGTVPPFIGEDYFCDTAIRGSTFTNGLFYPDDPLWDGHGCGSSSDCCGFNSPPWFCKKLPQPTTDDIELRLCDNGLPSEDDSPFEIVELYIN